MEEKIILDKTSFKALAADTRVKILKILGKRRHTQSELASDLNLSIPTVKEHLLALEKADLVSMKDEGRKWKYYELSRKGRGILDPEMKKIWILLSIIGLMVFAGLSGVIKQAFAPMYNVGIENSAQNIELNSAKDSVTNNDKLNTAIAKEINESEQKIDVGEQLNNSAKKSLVNKTQITEYKLPRPDFSGFSFNTGIKIYLGIIGILLGLLIYFSIIRYKRMH